MSHVRTRDTVSNPEFFAKERIFITGPANCSERISYENISSHTSGLRVCTSCKLNRNFRVPRSNQSEKPIANSCFIQRVGKLGGTLDSTTDRLGISRRPNHRNHKTDEERQDKYRCCQDTLLNPFCAHNLIVS